jgi:hypothetical protein
LLDVRNPLARKVLANSIEIKLCHLFAGIPGRIAVEPPNASFLRDEPRSRDPNAFFLSRADPRPMLPTFRFYV